MNTIVRNSARLGHCSWSSGRRALATGLTSQSLPDLPYDYGALEPVISGDIMEIHHSKHHATYVANYNKAAEGLLDALEKGDVEKVTSAQSAIKFNGGGHLNHSIFWQNLAPIGRGGGEVPTDGALIEKINAEFVTVDNMISRFNTMTAGVQGSGWGWLAYDSAKDSLMLTTCPNQDPLASTGLIPLLGVDVWEHAYYLQYKNARPSYLKEIWKVVNWADVAARYEAASA
uniref:Superoxide dismutase n=1 Tax=Rhodosorus marinus TaxID=101924 RepID=A0A7S0BPF6_9RHOD|mmetsp:Transcript_2598/g.3796  ORF Transcript_2598/g.3796 Transcript_2598/m.3796 type:complete len:230 (+) Transcript_2598:93-782(+)